MKATSAILTYIKTQNLQPGQRIPSERQLAERLQLSRGTVRRALLSLIARDYLERDPARRLVFTGRNRNLTKSVAILREHHPQFNDDLDSFRENFIQFFRKGLERSDADEVSNQRHQVGDQ